MKASRLVSIALLAPLLWSVACIKTRMDVKEEEEKQQLQETVQSLQQSQAEAAAQIVELQNELRGLRGNFEVATHQDSQTQQQKETATQEQAAKLQALEEQQGLVQEALEAQEERLNDLSEDVAKLQKSKKGKDDDKSKGGYTQAESDFESKKWQSAILGYQKYRELNQNGQRYPRATYRIAYSFHQLGMKDDAKPFYEELIAKFPQSSYTKQARSQLKKITAAK